MGKQLLYDAQKLKGKKGTFSYKARQRKKTCSPVASSIMLICIVFSQATLQRSWKTYDNTTQHIWAFTCQPNYFKIINNILHVGVVGTENIQENRSREINNESKSMSGSLATTIVHMQQNVKSCRAAHQATKQSFLKLHITIPRC